LRLLRSREKRSNLRGGYDYPLPVSCTILPDFSTRWAKSASKGCVRYPGRYPAIKADGAVALARRW